MEGVDFTAAPASFTEPIRIRLSFESPLPVITDVHLKTLDAKAVKQLALMVGIWTKNGEGTA